MATPCAAVVKLARRQYWAVARWRLLELGLGEPAIDHRLAIGRSGGSSPRDDLGERLERLAEREAEERLSLPA